MVFASEYAEGMVDDARRIMAGTSRPGGFDWPNFRTKLDAELWTGWKASTASSWRKAGCRDLRPARPDGRIRIPCELADGTRTTAQAYPDRHRRAPGDAGHTRNDGTGHHLQRDLPSRRAARQAILIVGGGYIACEFAGIMNGLGVQVTQYYRGAQILRGFDDEARVPGLRRDVPARHRSMHSRHQYPARCEHRRGADRIWVKADQWRPNACYDQVLVRHRAQAQFRRAGAGGAGREAAANGAIEVDDYTARPPVPSIYAVG